MGDATIIRLDPDESIPWYSMARALAQDRRLTWEARGVLTYLHSLPADWRVNPDALVKEAPGGKDRLYRILRELIEAGYVERTQERDDAGKVVRWVYIVRMLPLRGKPEVAEPDLAEPGITEDRGDRRQNSQHSAPNGAGAGAPPAEPNGNPQTSLAALIDHVRERTGNPTYRPDDHTIGKLTRAFEACYAAGATAAEVDAGAREWASLDRDASLLPSLVDARRRGGQRPNGQPAHVTPPREVQHDGRHDPACWCARPKQPRTEAVVAELDAELRRAGLLRSGNGAPATMPPPPRDEQLAALRELFEAGDQAATEPIPVGVDNLAADA